MEIRQLRYFIAVAEDLHFRKAAARLHMSQPPLSHQIRRLEQELGFALLHRTRRRVELTAAGRSFLADARATIARLDAAAEAARRISAGDAGRLRIGFVGSALLSVLPAAVQRFRTRHPGVHVELRERSTEDQLRAIRAGTIDVGFVPRPSEVGALAAHTVLRERAVAALPAAHPLATLRRVPLRRLASEPLVLFPRSQAPGLHDTLMASLTATGAVPRITQEAEETQTIVGLVAAGLGVSLVQASVQRLALPGIAYRPLSPAPMIELAAVTSPGPASPAARALLSSLERASG